METFVRRLHSHNVTPEQVSQKTSIPLEMVRELLRACYIFPDIAEQICIRLQKHLDEGD